MANQHGKKHKAALAALGNASILPITEVFKKVKELAYAKFDESVDVHVNLGIDPSKGDQSVRGSLLLPHGLGKKPRIIAFAKGEYAEQAEKAGADLVGAEDLIEKISAGWMEFDFAVATPDLMGKVGQLAKLLGPRGLLPNKKVGTVTFEVAAIIKELMQGRVFFKNDKSGLIHFRCGKVSFEASKLQDNFVAFFKALAASKPSSSKGQFILKITLASSMGVGIPVNVGEVLRTF